MTLDHSNLELTCPACSTTIPVDLVVSGTGDAIAKAACAQMKSHVDAGEASHIRLSYDAVIFMLKVLRVSASVLEHHYCPANFSANMN